AKVTRSAPDCMSAVVSATLTGSVYTISGTPSVAGTYNYIITTAGTCSPAATATGTITVNQQTITLSSAAATTSQSVCINTAITRSEERRVGEASATTTGLQK